jgi:tRNA pseudouridine55 synthase
MMRMEANSTIEGILAVDKPEGPTSHDAVACVRRALRSRRIGHTGTLDPFASGLLLLVLGRATRLAEFFAGLPKHYCAVLRLGAATDSDDRTGNVIATSDAWRDLSNHDIRVELERQQGMRLQVPPAVSAKKVGGQRAYAAAHRGAPITLQPVSIVIHSIRATRIDPPEVEFEVHCSAGTYVRAIARDAGAALGVHAHLQSLRRLAVGHFDVANALQLDRIDAATAQAAIIPPLQALAHLVHVDIERAAATIIAHGGSIPAPPGLPIAQPLALAHEGQLVAIAQQSDGWLHPEKVFFDV